METGRIPDIRALAWANRVRIDRERFPRAFRMPRHFLILFTLSTLASAGEKVTYDDQAFPIFQQSCLNCHNPDKTKGGLDLSTFAGAMKGGSGGKVVEPGDVTSNLIKALLPGAEKPMPPEGEKLSNDKIDVLKHWIEGGLLENKSSSARKPSKPKFETALRSDPAAKPDGPPPMPVDLLLEPPVVTPRASAVRAIAASPWAPLLAVTGQHQVLLHHTESLELVGILPFPEGDPVSLAFTPDARYLIVGGGIPGKSGVTVTYDIVTGARLLTVAKEFDSILASDIRPGFDLVATGGPSRLLKLWNTETGELVKSIKKHTDWITALDLSNDGVLLASGDRNGGVWVWESETGNEYLTLSGHQAGISATVFRGDSNILATASEDGSVRFWEMNGGSEVKKIDAHPGGVTAFAFGRDGSSITTGRDKTAKLWKPDFTPVRDLTKDLPALPTAVALDSEGKKAFVADANGTIRVFLTADSRPAGEIQSNPPTIQARLDFLATVISSRERALTDAGKEAKQPSPEINKIQDQLVTLKAAVKRWTAAAINTKAIFTRRESEDLSIALEDSQVNFTRSADQISVQQKVLATKRAEREQFAHQFKNLPLSEETTAEIAATLTAIDISIGRELETLRKFQDEVIASRDSIEQAALIAQAKRTETASLTTAYRKALE